MLDRTDFESWQQRIRLYCLGKDNGENIMKSITEGPFRMGTFIQTPAEETEGALQPGPERTRVFTDLSAEEKERYKADIRATNILLKGICWELNTSELVLPRDDLVLLSQQLVLLEMRGPPPHGLFNNFNLEEPLENPEPLAPMDDTRTMAQLLEAPTAGYEDAIVVPEIAADNFELKHAQIWLEKEPPRSIQTWDDLVSKFINKFFPPSKTTNLRNEITRFQQRFDETFYEAWDRFNDLLRAFRNSRNKPVVAKVSSSTSTPGISSEVAKLKDMEKCYILDKKNQSPAPTPVKAVEESCVTCGGAHSYQTCPATTGNVYRDNIQEYVSQAAAANYNQGNTGYRAPISNQIRPPGFPPVQNNHVQNQGNNQNRYNQNRGNFNQAPAYQPPVNQGQIYRPQVVQPPAYQAPAYQAPAPQTQGVSKTNFDSYVKANGSVMEVKKKEYAKPKSSFANSRSKPANSIEQLGYFKSKA
ncbi:reverse transcriptase domain-containing protein [Tanacetum coccineum]|uniref:Reverse transcriptase domain-containing protein n=1 Tax=Tanacetum coccineum TaxID=301880 RepID=A0ABQ5BVN5_9ASTR